jgi:hypothetical protein
VVGDCAGSYRNARRKCTRHLTCLELSRDLPLANRENSTGCQASSLKFVRLGGLASVASVALARGVHRRVGVDVGPRLPGSLRLEEYDSPLIFIPKADDPAGRAS